MKGEKHECVKSLQQSRASQNDKSKEHLLARMLVNRSKTELYKAIRVPI